MRKQRLPSVIGQLAVFIVGLTAAASISAKSFETLENLNQSQFLEFSKELSAATHYKSIAPPETLGTLGFDIGLEVSSTDISGDVFDISSAGNFDGSDLIIPRLHVHKGLPFGIDLGASVGAIPDSDARVLGAEVRYAIIDGGAVTPALGIRATYAVVTGIDDLDMQNYGLELGISKGFLFFTPYAGVGIVGASSKPNDITGLTEETFEERKFALGATINVGVALTVEADMTGDIRTYSAKVGFRF